MLDESRVELETLEARKAELAAQRDAELDQVRRRYIEQMRTVDAELATIRRLERALLPPEERKAKPKPPARKVGPSWNPSDDTLRAVLGSFDGEATIRELAEGSGKSKATVEKVVVKGRDDGIIRLVGVRTNAQGRNPTRTYRLTPDGETRMAELTRNGATPRE